MLQQTRVETVVPYFERFMKSFPTPLALAEAPEDEVLAAWSGLGYYRRARLLQAGARLAAERGMPSDRDGLLALPGVGRYTAGAIASIAFGEAVGLVDGNVARVLARIFAIDEDIKRAGMRRAEELADLLVPEEDPGAFNQSLMELGATVCTPRTPRCDRCPVLSSCRAHAEGRVGELPVVGDRPKPRQQRVQALVATWGGRVLLARRRPGGLFGGLWEPPSLDGASKARRDLFARFGLRSVELRGRVTHVLSHRRLAVDVHAAVLERDPVGVDLPDAYDAAALFEPADLSGVGIATLARKVLAIVLPMTNGSR
jgi:A/G-specific adenine glycosylase